MTFPKRMNIRSFGPATHTACCVMATVKHVIKSEGFCRHIWAMHFAGLLHRNSDVSKHERKINAVEIDAWVCAWYRIHEPAMQHAYFTTKQIQAPRRSLLDLLRRVDPVNKTKLGLTSIQQQRGVATVWWKRPSRHPRGR